MIEARCRKCDETFIADDEADLAHVETFMCEPCGGTADVAGYAYRIRKYADKIMEMIREDVAEGIVPATVTDFGELHSHLDANDYLIHAGQVYDASEESCDEINAIETEVSRRLARGDLRTEPTR